MNARKMKQQQNAAIVIPPKTDHPERKPCEQLLIGLEDQVLIECYHNAVEMKLEDDFIELLRKEIAERGITNHMQTLDPQLQDVQNA